ncbi:GGDEF domain-containing protein [Salinivibrio socompensis]|uniref:GGDEF domain-containing protein n=1 Tax=Salinivibrio socompensis TaxID=1510206 RepID=UPI0004B7E67C|nr:GGDEF domain-containing protein [Salinivibrio socompensis]
MSVPSAFAQNSIEDHAAFVSVLCATITLVFFDVPFISSLIFSLAGLLLIANQVSFSHQLAFIDGLTEIAGRRALEDELKHLGRRYTLAMLDVDHFKQFNDTYGHETGDDVLKLVAKQMAHCEGGASAFRYGGEEFTLLFKGKTTEHCLPFLDALREGIANYPLVLRDQSRPHDDEQGRQKRGRVSDTKPVNITVSIGYADASQADTSNEVLQLADKALYKAKEAGRNCIKGSA